MADKDMDEAFKDWWEVDPDDEDYEPMPDVTEERARDIFMAGYMYGSRKPIYQMNATQYAVIVRMIEEKIRKEKE